MGPELPQCIAPRVLAQSGSYTLPCQPTRSAIQGLRSGTRFAKVITYKAMRRVTQVHARCTHRIWVDDLSRRT
eukprot:7310009-Pyramimonas_sp.AAC.1